MAISRMLLLGSGLVSLAVAGAELYPIHRGRTRPGYISGIPCGNYPLQARSPSATVVSRTGVLLRTSTRVADVLASPPSVTVREYHDELIRRYLPGNVPEVERRISRTIPTESQSALKEKAPPLPPRHDPSDVVKLGIGRHVFTERVTAVAPPVELPRQSVIELYQLDQPRLQVDHCEISQVALQLHDDGRWVLSLRADQNRRPSNGEPIEYNPRLHLKRNQFIVHLRCFGAFPNQAGDMELAAGKPVMVALDPPPFWVENGQPHYERFEGRSELVTENFQEIDRVEIEFFYR